MKNLYGMQSCYIRVSTHIAGLAAKPKDVLDTLDLTNFGVKNSSCILESVPLQLKTLRHYKLATRIKDNRITRQDEF